MNAPLNMSIAVADPPPESVAAGFVAVLIVQDDAGDSQLEAALGIEAVNTLLILLAQAKKRNAPDG